MGYLKSAAEILALQQAMREPQYLQGSTLTNRFLTDATSIADILPPGLEPDKAPVATLTISAFEGGVVGPFRSAALYVSARHKEVCGNYILAMYVTGDGPVIFGRSIYGEPKFHGDVVFERNGGAMRAKVSHAGQHIMEVEAEIDDAPVATPPSPIIVFTYLAQFSPVTADLIGDAHLVVMHQHVDYRIHREGKGKIKLHGNDLDPLNELPVRSIISTSYTEADSIVKPQIVQSIAGADFLPYAIGRMPDWNVLQRNKANYA